MTKKTILCVDDEQSLSIHKVTLETRGYRVKTSNTVEGALEIFYSGGLDLILSNVELPGASAQAFVKRVKALAPELPIILLSPHYDCRVDCRIDNQADLLLRKGTFAPAELLQHIRTLLIKRRGPHRVVMSAIARGASAS